MPLNVIDEGKSYDACGMGNNCIIDIAVTDFPETDSPTKAKVLLFSILKLISFTAENDPSLTLKLILKFLPLLYFS